MKLIELSVIAHAKEGVVKSGGAGEVELLDLEDLLLGPDVPDTDLLLAAGDQSIFLDSLCEKDDVFSMGNEL